MQSELDASQREYVLRQQLKAIQEELGETDEAEAEARDLREQLDAAGLPDEVRRVADRELGRLEKLPPMAAEHGVIRTYLEWLAMLPWSAATTDDLDLAHAREVLDADHYDIEQVKERILEFLAVRRLKPDARGSIMCFVGPPGVGKTSLGRSIARALGRRFERISAGGVRDESEIRGHRRTYVGAMPGAIIRALRDAESNNPLFMIDEIDKMGSDFRGDPASAMLEVLDPEQNATFRDHYLDVPFDLSHVMFVDDGQHAGHDPRAAARPHGGHPAGRLHRGGEAADRQALPGAAPDRAQRPQALADHGRRRRAARRSSATTRARRACAAWSARSARSAARWPARWPRGRAPRRTSVSRAKVRELLGKPRFHAEAKRRTREPGVATGLAWTPVGGDVLFVEASAMPGKGKLTITGQLGDVMRESAQAALSYVRAHPPADVDSTWFADHDLHVHVPAGAIPKDGPSAGVTMVTALTSLLSGVPVRDDTAMTGEVTLTGQVLPIGGLKEKALAAQRAGLRRVIAPADNEADADEVPEHLREDLDFVFVRDVQEVLTAALAQGATANGRVYAQHRSRKATRGK